MIQETRHSFLCFFAVGVAAWCFAAPRLAAQGTAGVPQDIQAFFGTHCFDCHANGTAEGNLALDALLADSAADPDPERWWTVLRNLRAGTMPPADHDRPEPDAVEAVASWIKFDIFKIDPDIPDPGRATIRRLNRTEYGNTIRDLMGIPFDATIVFPPDDAGFGFDNVADALTFSPLLMEKYLRAAQTIVARAVPQQTWITPTRVLDGRSFADPERDIRGNRISSRQAARVAATVSIDEPGRYDIHVVVRLHGSFDFDPSRYTVQFLIDGSEKSTQEFGWDENRPVRMAYHEDWQAGDHLLEFVTTPLPLPDGVDDEPGDTFVSFEVDDVTVEGPLGVGRFVHPERYERFFTRDEPPEDLPGRLIYANEILKRFATRAFRGPVEPATLDRLTDIAAAAWQQPDASFESGIAQAMTAVLASPRFLFRLESTEATADAEAHSLVNELSLASRLSYFLWSTMPDEELFGLAESGQLRAQLPGQVSRMLKDDRARDFIRNFAGQWLRTRDVRQTSIDPIVVLGYGDEYQQLLQQFRSRRNRSFRRELTPEEEQVRSRFRELREIADRFDDELKRSMSRETEMCVEHIAREDGSLLDLLDCDYTFLNEPLARHYGISDVEGSDMRRVALPPDSPRGGVLTHASMLLVTSNPTRTSPVKRGLFVLENILGTPAPPPPGNVPDLEDSAGRFGDREPTLRELLAVHRESALCSSCHARMDPLGLALENFNALGMWRDSEHDQAIDSSGQLITGETFQDVRELKRILREDHADDFYRCVTEKLLTFALGRGLDYADAQTVDIIVDRLQRSDGRFSELLNGVIESTPFQRQRNRSEAISSR